MAAKITMKNLASRAKYAVASLLIVSAWPPVMVMMRADELVIPDAPDAEALASAGFGVSQRKWI